VTNSALTDILARLRLPSALVTVNTLALATRSFHSGRDRVEVPLLIFLALYVYLLGMYPGRNYDVKCRIIDMYTHSRYCI
jgi:hypothetical protein